MTYTEILERCGQALDNDKATIFLYVTRASRRADDSKFPWGRKVGMLDNGQEMREVPVKSILNWTLRNVRAREINCWLGSS